MKILVTGGLGAVGTPLTDELRRRGNEVWVCDKPHHHGLNGQFYRRCDVGEYRQVESLFDENKFDTVYHMAAEFGRRNGEDHYETLWKSNAIGTKNMIRMQEKHCFRMIFFSSSEVYGDWGGVMTEDVPHKNPLRQLNDYAITKWVGEMQVLNSADRFATETVRVRLFNTYGPGEPYSEYRSVACLFVYRALHNIPYTVYLNHHRSSTYIDDCVRTLANISERFKPGEVYNICGNEYHDIKYMSDLILNYLGKDDSLVTYVDVEAHNTLNKKGDDTKAVRELDHKVTVSLEEGIPRTIEWQKKVYGAK